MTELPLAPVLFVSHGGGPLPLLADPGHQELVKTLKAITASIQRPDAIVVISAHWEADGFKITGHPQPQMIYDYTGFPPNAYDINYPAPGSPELAQELKNVLLHHKLPAKLSSSRGFDHGVFVPLNIMFPEADIPLCCISLNRNLDPKQHINLGKALAELRKKNVLILGSGMSFHNLPLFFDAQRALTQQANNAFNTWLDQTLSESFETEFSRSEALINWEVASYGRTCHPCEEHLLPLHVCFGAAQSEVKHIYKMDIMGIESRCYLW